MNFATLLELILGLVGGLGIFLLGMKNMSEGMQAVAGSRLRRMIAAVTNNRYFAACVGAMVTCLVQSSSITTVMVVGFVNSGVMLLSQAIGVIMGANIGTTITGWILVLNIGRFGLPIFGAAALLYLFSRNDRVRYVALALMGMGMVFFGLETMKDACAVIKQMPKFDAWFQAFSADTYVGVLKCALVGCIMTTLVQSSSATLGITISLASQGVITFETAAALVLGENIGTTITALLASLGATTAARRAAYFHAIFNVAGVLWITAIFQWYITAIQWGLGGDIAEKVIIDGNEFYPKVTAGIAATHSVFNIANTAVFLPFLGVFVRLLHWLVPESAGDEKQDFSALDIRLLDSPQLAIEQARLAITRMAEGCTEMLVWFDQALNQETLDKQLSQRIRNREQELDAMQDDVTRFVTSLLAGNISRQVADESRRTIRMADEYESVSDYVADLEKFDRKLRRDGFAFTAEQKTDLNELNQRSREYLARINTVRLNRDRNQLIESHTINRQLRDRIKQIRQQHLEDLSEGQIAPMVNVAFLASLNAYARVRGHVRNIVDACSEDPPQKDTQKETAQ